MPTLLVIWPQGHLCTCMRLNVMEIDIWNGVRLQIVVVTSLRSFYLSWRVENEIRILLLLIQHTLMQKSLENPSDRKGFHNTVFGHSIIRNNLQLGYGSLLSLYALESLVRSL